MSRGAIDWREGRSMPLMTLPPSKVCQTTIMGFLLNMRHPWIFPPGKNKNAEFFQVRYNPNVFPFMTR